MGVEIGKSGEKFGEVEPCGEWRKREVEGEVAAGTEVHYEVEEGRGL